MSTFYNLYVSRAVKGIDVTKLNTYKDIKPISNMMSAKLLNTQIVHTYPVNKNIKEWCWQQYLKYVLYTNISNKFFIWKNESEIKSFYNYYFGELMNVQKVKDWMAYKTLDLKELCNTGIASHLVEWRKDHYVVDLNSLSTYEVKEGIYPYGCKLVLNAHLEPQYITSCFKPIVTSKKVTGYNKEEFKCDMQDELWQFQVRQFLSSLLAKILLIDNVLCSRFIYSGNIISSIVSYKSLIPKDMLEFMTPFVFGTANRNHRLYSEFLQPGGVFDRIFGFKDISRYINHESDFSYWESPKDLFYKNIYYDEPIWNDDKNVDHLKSCTKCQTNRKFPRWYYDAVTYWEFIERFVGKWFKRFYINLSSDEKNKLDKWLILYESKKRGMVHDTHEVRIQVMLTSLIWNSSFFNRHINIANLAFRPGLIDTKIFLGQNEPNKYDNIGLATFCMLFELEEQPQMIGSLWITQNKKYRDIWVQMERDLEKMEFKSLNLIGGELQCCI